MQEPGTMHLPQSLSTTALWLQICIQRRKLYSRDSGVYFVLAYQQTSPVDVINIVTHGECVGPPCSSIANCWSVVRRLSHCMSSWERESESYKIGVYTSWSTNRHAYLHRHKGIGCDVQRGPNNTDKRSCFLFTAGLKGDPKVSHFGIFIKSYWKPIYETI